MRDKVSHFVKKISDKALDMANLKNKTQKIVRTIKKLLVFTTINKNDDKKQQQHYNNNNNKICPVEHKSCVLPSTLSLKVKLQGQMFLLLLDHRHI